MTVTTVPVDVGTVAGDGTGDDARTAFQAVNTSVANLKSAVEYLQGRLWTVQNSSTTVALGARYVGNNHAGITLTMPGTFAVSATSFSDIWIANGDDASNITLTPASGDAFFVGGATNGVDTSYALEPGQIAILSPRTTDSEWDLILIGSRPLESLIIAVSDETSDLSTGEGKVTFRMPYAFTLLDVRASVTTAPTGAALTVDINESGSTILSTVLSIDAGEKTSTTAASAAVISDPSLADDAEITIDIDQIGSSVAGAGLKVCLIGIRA